jgi:hypothetical protein
MFTRTCQKAASCSPISRSRRGALSLVALVSILCSAGLTSGADLSQAVLRRKENVVTRASNLSAQAQPIAQGAVIDDGSVVRTGTASKAELQFADLTLARLGSNSNFSFDAKARVMNATQGAVLFGKPSNSGTIQLKSGAISGAITGSTGFISTVPMEGIGKAGQTRSNGKGNTTIIGMLEGKVHGETRWTDSAGREHTTPFKLGPGQMMVARSDGAPRMNDFDIPRFVKTSPLVKMGPLPNAAAIDRAIADYQADERGGFVNNTNIRVSTQPISMGLVGKVVPLDTVAQIQNQQPNGLLPVGTTGIIQAQLIWNTAADLDLYLTLPNGQIVSFSNVAVTFNNGRAIARLDQDNRGGRIDIQPTTRVENISINGVPLNGLYRFFANNFSSPNGTDPFRLVVFFNGRTQIINGTLAVGQNSQPIFVQVPGR